MKASINYEHEEVHPTTMHTLLPVREGETRRVAADVPASLFREADRIRRDNHWFWTEVLSAALRKLVNDSKLNKNPSLFNS